MKTTYQTIVTLVYLDANENELTRNNVSFECMDMNDWQIKAEQLRQVAEANCNIIDCVQVVIL
jgi:hypothetical protein